MSGPVRLDPPPHAVAIVGMAGRFPDAPDLDALWANLVDGRTAIRPLTVRQREADRCSAFGTGLPPAAAAVLDDADCFDAEFFGIGEDEARITDPQHRIFLESVWHALEDAGHDPRRCPPATGLFAGSCFPTYLLGTLAHRSDLIRAHGWLPLVVANDCDSLTSMVSYKLDLRGPSMTVRTFSSTSLVAVHLATQSLLSRECDLAVAGAVAVKFPQGLAFPGVTSPSGTCRVFDAGADGSVTGNAVAAVVLKRAEDAVRDGDHVRALILGSATNTDGAQRAGYTVPAVAGKAEVVAEALANAGVDPGGVGYVEAHAMGTKLGDEIEVSALAKVFGDRRGAAGPCRIGSIAANVGHLDAVAGIAGLVKAALMLEHRRFVGQPGFRTPNAALRASSSVLRVAEDGDWVSDQPRRAGVSSFGLGGVNAHVVLQEAPARQPTPVADPDSGLPQLFVLSARSPHALGEMIKDLREWMARNPLASLPDVAYTLQVGRAEFSHRRAVVAAGHRTALQALSAPCLAPAYPRGRPRPGAAVDVLRIIADLAGAEPVRRGLLLGELAEIWSAGTTVPWRAANREALYGPGKRGRISLPGYPFERRRYWPDLPDEMAEKIS